MAKSLHILKRKIKAGALYYTILISFIIAAILIALIMHNYLQNRYTDMLIMQDKVSRNAGSAIQMMLGNPALCEYNKETEINLFDDDNEKVTVSKKKWGGYDIFNAKAEWKNYSVLKSALCGINKAGHDSTALYLSDENIYLSVCGSTLIKGNCKLPKMGVRKANIEGKFYKNEKEIYGKIGASSNSLPKIITSINNFISKIRKQDNLTNDSIISFNDLNQRFACRSFREKTLIAYDPGIIYLKRQKINGNIVIVSDMGIRIAKEAKLNNIIIVAPRIHFEQAFTGQVQAFATDSMVVDKNCYFKLPSLLAIFNENINQAGISIDEDVIIAGGVILFQENKPVNPSILDIGKNTTIYGTVYINGNVQVKGTIYGSLYCNRFFLQTPAAYYENHLLDAIINNTDLPKSFTGYQLFENEKDMKIIEWLK